VDGARDHGLDPGRDLLVPGRKTTQLVDVTPWLNE
jgi:hypothetical protein